MQIPLFVALLILAPAAYAAQILELPIAGTEKIEERKWLGFWKYRRQSSPQRILRLELDEAGDRILLSQNGGAQWAELFAGRVDRLHLFESFDSPALRARVPADRPDLFIFGANFVFNLNGSVWKLYIKSGDGLFVVNPWRKHRFPWMGEVLQAADLDVGAVHYRTLSLKCTEGEGTFVTVDKQEDRPIQLLSHFTWDTPRVRVSGGEIIYQDLKRVIDMNDVEGERATPPARDTYMIEQRQETLRKMQGWYDGMSYQLYAILTPPPGIAARAAEYVAILNDPELKRYVGDSRLQTIAERTVRHILLTQFPEIRTLRDDPNVARAMASFATQVGRLWIRGEVDDRFVQETIADSLEMPAEGRRPKCALYLLKTGSVATEIKRTAARDLGFLYQRLRELRERGIK